MRFQKAVLLLLFVSLVPLFAQSFVDGESFGGGESFTEGESFTGGESFVGGESFIDGESFVGGESIVGGNGRKVGVYESTVEPSYTGTYANTYDSVYEDAYSDVYVNGYGKWLKTMADASPAEREKFVQYFSDWQWSGQKEDFFSYSASRSEQEWQLSHCYDEAIKKFGVGTAIIATTWIVSFAVPGGTIYQVAIISIAKATTVGALSGGAIGAVSSAGIAYLQGKRGDELVCETVKGAADGYLIGAVTGLVQGTVSAVKMVKNAPKFTGATGEVKTVLNGKVYDGKGKFIGEFRGEYPKSTIHMDKVGTVWNGVPYEWQIVNDAEGNFYKAVMPRFEGPTIKLPEALQFAGRKAHNDYILKVLQSPQLCAENGISQKTADHLLKHLNEYTVHHLGEKNMLQIVDFATHSAARHTGGISMWGKAGL